MGRVFRIMRGRRSLSVGVFIPSFEY